MTKLFEKYELFKGNLRQKKLEPKEYQKLVKEWMNQNEGRKKKKSKKQEKEKRSTCSVFFIKKLQKVLVFCSGLVYNEEN